MDDHPSDDERLDSWKAIAAHLRRDVRTVQRWEKSEALPVHRHLHRKGDSIYAFRGELDRWWKDRASRVESTAESRRVMLAVLPFENWSGDPEQDYFSDGITEEMIVRIGRLNPERLGVIAMESATAYKKKDKPLSQIRRELGVGYVVGGTVRRADSRVRITAHLIETRSQRQIWAESYDRHLSDILSLQSEVAEAVANGVQVTLASHVGEMRRARVDPAAYEALLKGRYCLSKRTPDALGRSVQHFEHAIAIDPGDPLAHIGLADAHVLIAYYGLSSPNEVFPRAKAAAEKALALDETLPEAHAVLAEVLYLHEWSWQAAERSFERAIELGPNSVSARHEYGMFLSLRGRHEESLRELEKALRLDPLSLVLAADKGLVLYGARRYDEAIAQHRRTLELDPNFALAHTWLALAYLQTSKISEAIAEVRAASALAPGDLTPIAILGYAYAVSGKRGEARKILQRLKELSKERTASAAYAAAVHIGLGDDDAAFEVATQALDERSGFLTRLGVEPLFDRVRPDPRFQDLMRAVGLESGEATRRREEPKAHPRKKRRAPEPA